MDFFRKYSNSTHIRLFSQKQDHFSYEIEVVITISNMMEKYCVLKKQFSRGRGIKNALKKCSKFIVEHLSRSAISIKLLCNWHGCCPVNLLHIFRTPFPKNTSGGLLLVLDPIYSSNLQKKSLLNDQNFLVCFELFNRDLNHGCLVYIFSLRFSGSRFLINFGGNFVYVKLFRVS